MKSNLDLVLILKALADPTRLKIFKLLMGGEYCNCELNKVTGLPINLVSHHLRILKEAGLVNAVRDNKDTRWIHFSINEENLKEVRQAIESLLEIPDVPRRASDCPSSKKRKVIEQ